MVAKGLCLALALFCAVSASSDSRLWGGSPATIEQFPAVVALVYHYPGPNIHIQRCVGALVSSWHVVTSVFCLTGATLTNFKIRAGSAESLSGGLLRDVRQAIQHPEYDAETRANDIAVLVLSQPVFISDTVNVLYIPPANTYLPPGLETSVVSWGFETFFNPDAAGYYPPTTVDIEELSIEDGPQHSSLKNITLTTQSLERCKEAYEDEDDIEISDTVICASNESAGTCFGDSGAPMIYRNVFIGIASYYKGCGNSAYPDVFTRVDRFTDWIMEVAVAPTGETPLRSII